MEVSIDRDAKGRLVFAESDLIHPVAVVDVPDSSRLVRVNKTLFLMVRSLEDPRLSFAASPKDILRKSINGDRRFQIIDVAVAMTKFDVRSN